ncbi:MAG: hypothetical protein JXR46_06945 [Calditrichaceae bacterium]|nr:hypothetical protein [Calditrichaceae bacterium]MBN2708766.1 hypothetical protein [Calditrichaceae bacterium]RQV97703.1 MAG: hypothetical protein EH224_01405 [Calditrichota bacterium]
MDLELPQLVRFNISFFTFILTAGVSIGICYWLYRYTNPMLSEKKRLFLGIIRFIPVFLTILMLFKPGISYLVKKPYTPKTLIYIDNSQSMNYKSPVENRKEILNNTIEKLKTALKPSDEISWFFFNSAVYSYETDTLEISKRATDFNVVFDQIRKENPGRVILISDGNHTLGPYPLSGINFLDAEFYSIGIGKEFLDKDIKISNVEYPAIGYQGEEYSIRIMIEYTGLEKDSSVTMNLFSSNRLIERKKINLFAGNSGTSVEFKIKPDKAGLHRYRAQVSPVNLETNLQNNHYVFVQEVLKKKVNLSLFSPDPNYESKFLSLVLNENPDYQLSAFIQKTNSRFYNTVNLSMVDSSDILVFVDFPITGTQAGIVEHIREKHQKQNFSLFILNTGRIDIQLLRKIEPDLIFDYKAGGYADQQSASYLLHDQHAYSYLAEFYEKELNTIFWKQIPPLSFKKRIKTDENADLIISSEIRGQNQPVFFISEKSGRMAVLNGEGFWKWHFLMQGDAVFSDGFSRFISNIVRWLSDKHKIKPFQIYTEKNIVYDGEQIEITGKLFDATYKPVINGTVSFTVNYGDETYQIESSPDSAGNYRSWFNPPAEGTYIISGEGYKNDILIGRDKIKIEVIPYNPELSKVTLNKKFLTDASNLGNGKYFNYYEMDSLFSILEKGSTQIIEEKKLELWYIPFVLIIIIAFISLEWYLRKRYSLV